MSADRSQLKGVLLAIGAFTCFVLADSSIKALGHFRMPVAEVVGGAGLLEACLLVLASVVRGALRTQAMADSRWKGAQASADGAGHSMRAQLRIQLRALWPRSPGRALSRAMLDLVNNVFVVIALRHLPLALFYILVFLAPAATTLLESLTLRERLGWRRILAVMTGFAGVVVAVNPLSTVHAADATGVLACMVCVACFSVNMTWSRRIMRDERPQAMTFASSLLQGGAGALMLAWHAQPLTHTSALLLLTVAVVSGVGGLWFFLALRLTSAATVSQYHYTQLVTGAAVAYAIWRERPTPAMYAGAALILVSGALAAHLVRTQPAMIPEL